MKENEPFDLKAEVQARYAPLIGNTKAVKGKTVLAADACKAALAPWLMAVEAESAGLPGPANRPRKPPGWPLRPLAPLPLMIWPPRSRRAVL